MVKPYLNPIELFDLTGPDPPEQAEVRRAHKRHLTVLELDDTAFFTFQGKEFSRNDLDEVVTLCKDEAWLHAYHYAAMEPSLSAFLGQGIVSAELSTINLGNPRLQPLIRPYFAAAFDRAFLHGLKDGYTSDISLLKGLTGPALGVSDRHLYRSSEELLRERGRQFVADTQRRANSRTTLSKDGRGLGKIVEEFREAFPRKVTASLPEYFSRLFNDLASDLNDPILTLYNKQRRYTLCQKLIRELQALPHLTVANRDELKRLSREMMGSSFEGWAEETDQNQGKIFGIPWRYYVFAILGLLLLFRITSCVSNAA